MTNYDAIVIGACGGMGSAAMFHLAGRGVKVLGLDRFPPGHYRGSSHGRTRIIRQAYFEHPDYVPMLREAYRLWDELGRLHGQPLIHETGLLQVGPAEGAVVRGVLHSAKQHGLDVEQLAAADVTQRWSGFEVPPGMLGVYEQRAGYLEVENCVIAHVAQAQRRGAQLRTGETVQSWRADEHGLVVQTDRGSYSAERIVIAAGPWSGEVLADLDLKLVVRRKPQYWFACDVRNTYQAAAGYPAFLFELPEGVFYGLPAIDEAGVKVARHSGGEEVPNPLELAQYLDEADLETVRQFTAKCLPQLGSQPRHHDPCMYTLSEDEHFIVDRHPRDPRVVFAAGLSGHGFKFTGVLGKLLAELALEGRTSLACGFLSLDRFSRR